MEEYGVLLGAKDQATMVFRKVKYEMQQLAGEATKAQNAIAQPEQATRRYARTLEGLNDRLRDYKAQRSLVNTSDLHMLNRYNQLIDGTKRRIRELTAAKKADAAVPQPVGGGMRGGIGQLIQAPPMGGLPGRLAGMVAGGLNPWMIASAGVGTATAFAVRQGLTFERAMSKVNATALLDPAGRRQLSEQVMDIAQANGADATEAANALEVIISQTNDLKKSMELLGPTMRAAKAGFVDVSTAAAAGAQILSATAGKEKLTAQEIYDTLQKAKQEGAGDYSDFANNIPRLVATGSLMGLDFKQVAGAYSGFTGLGHRGDASAMLLENLFTFLQRSKQSDFKSVGLSKFDASGQRIDLLKLIGSIRDKTANMNDQQRENFYRALGLNDAQARAAVGVFVGGFDKMKIVMGEVADSADSVAEALAKTGDKLRNLEKLKNIASNYATRFGDILLQTLDMKIGAYLHGLRSLDNYVESGSVGENERASWRSKFAMQSWRNQTANRLGLPTLGLDPSRPVGMSEAQSLVEKLKGGASTTAQAVQLETQAAVDEISDGGRKVLSYTVNINKMTGVERQEFGGMPDRASAQQASMQILEQVNRALQAGSPNLAVR